MSFRKQGEFEMFNFLFFIFTNIWKLQSLFERANLRKYGSDLKNISVLDSQIVIRF